MGLWSFNTLDAAREAFTYQHTTVLLFSAIPMSPALSFRGMTA